MEIIEVPVDSADFYQMQSFRFIVSFLPTMPPRFHIATGLCSLFSSVVLLAIFIGFIPQQRQIQLEHRMQLSEAVAATTALLLQRGDDRGIKTSLEFLVKRNPDINGIGIYDNNRDSLKLFRPSPEHNDLSSDDARSAISHEGFANSHQSSLIAVPLLKGSREWGELRFFYRPREALTLFERLQESTLALMLFLSLLTFPLFYYFLGKMLKELNPSQAIPGRVRSALDTIAESLLVMDRRGNLVLANAAFSELIGTASDKLVGQHIQNFPWDFESTDSSHTESAPEAPWDVALRTGETIRNSMLSFEDNSDLRRKFIVNCSPVLGPKGKPGGVLISLDDVTLLEEKEVLLRQSMEEAKAANESKTSFLSNMSHEIRTPMTAILGFTEVLKRGMNQSPSDRQKHLNTISSSGEHLLELINDVLDLSKVESGAMEFEAIACDPVEIAHTVVQVLGVKAREKEIELALDLQTEMPEHIMSDPSRLRQILTNLVGNAIKFTEQGSVSIAMIFDTEAEPPVLKFAVKDTGIGMTDAQAASIFDAFTQADVSITRRFGGTGLGLSISKKLAQALGGDIVVTSEAGIGSTFSVDLPIENLDSLSLRSPAEALAALDHAALDEKIIWKFPKCSVLVVDDAIENRELLKLVLGDLGIGFSEAANGQVAVDKVTAENFDLVLMDIQMPVMDGYQAVSSIREMGKSLPIMGLTANAMKGYEVNLLSSGFTHYLSKPIDLDRLTLMLAELLGGEQVGVRDSQALPSVAVDDSIKATAEFDATCSPIISTLAVGNPRFQIIARQFTERLEERMTELSEAVERKDYVEIASFAHWLKGSSGTVGYPQISTAAAKLEIAAKSEVAGEAVINFEKLRQLQSRIVHDYDDDRSAPDPAAASKPSIEPSVDQAHDGGVSLDSMEPIFSDFARNNARMMSIVGRFIPRLNEQMQNLEKAVAANNFTEVASIAHWLKGSSGNVGFAEFTPLAAELEDYAHNSELEKTRQSLSKILQFAGRVNAGWQGVEPVRRSA